MFPTWMTRGPLFPVHTGGSTAKWLNADNIEYAIHTDATVVMSLVGVEQDKVFSIPQPGMFPVNIQNLWNHSTCLYGTPPKPTNLYVNMAHVVEVSMDFSDPTKDFIEFASGKKITGVTNWVQINPPS